MNAARAIIADDEDLPRAELRRMLALAWPELEIVAECEHGPAAVEAIEEHRPDIAFLDIRMPGQAASMSRARPAGAAISSSRPRTTAMPSRPSTPARWTICSSR